MRTQLSFLKTSWLYTIVLINDNFAICPSCHIFRDVKPENVLILSDQNTDGLDTVPVSGLKVKLGDFGLARYFTSAEGTVAMTTVGTGLYSAPEIRSNLDMGLSNSEYTETCDIFSAGVLAHELFTGKLEKGNYNFKLSYIDCTIILIK